MMPWSSLGRARLFTWSLNDLMSACEITFPWFLLQRAANNDYLINSQAKLKIVHHAWLFNFN